MESATVFDPRSAFQNALMVKKYGSNFFDETDWKLEKELNEKNHTLLECKKFDGYPLAHYRATTTVKLPREKLVSIVWDATPDSAKLDDPGIVSLDVLESHTETPDMTAYKVRRQINKLPWPCWKRETVFSQFKFDDENSTWLVGFSADHQDAPRDDSNYVRTNVELSVYRYTSIDSGTTCVQCIKNINPNGLIPEFVIKTQAKRLVNAFNRWHNLGKE